MTLRETRARTRDQHSGRTRVTPVFTWLQAHGGSGWVTELLRLADGIKVADSIGEYEMLTARFPFEAVDFSDEHQFRLGLAKTRAKTPEPPSTIAKGVPPWLDEVCLRALQPDLRNRFPSAIEFLASLEAAKNNPMDVQKQASHLVGSNESALQKAREAVDLGGQYAELPRAIELMERAFALHESLRDKYGSILDKWKSGVIL
jgi:hypothetical protein